MTLLVRSFSVLLMAAALCFVSCEDKNKPDQSLNGNVVRPTWTATENADLSTSMTAVIKVDSLNGKAINDSVVSDKDLLAAFAGNNCLGVATYSEGLFYLYIDGTEGNVTLRYYSSHYTNLFEAVDAFPFVNDTQKGTVASPFVPAFVVAK